MTGPTERTSITLDLAPLWICLWSWKNISSRTHFHPQAITGTGTTTHVLRPHSNSDVMPATPSASWNSWGWLVERKPRICSRTADLPRKLRGSAPLWHFLLSGDSYCALDPEVGQGSHQFVQFQCGWCRRWLCRAGLWKECSRFNKPTKSNIQSDITKLKTGQLQWFFSSFLERERITSEMLTSNTAMIIKDSIRLWVCCRLLLCDYLNELYLLDSYTHRKTDVSSLVSLHSSENWCEIKLRLGRTLSLSVCYKLHYG